ncbi:hypothetical protein ACEPAI_2623 [Sanghuangporus weigelae]
MPTSFLQSVFNSNPSSPRLSYRDPNFVKDDPSDFMDYLIPFSSPENSVDEDILRRQFETGEIQFNELITNGSPSSASETLSSPENSLSSSDNAAEVDDAFISQISCFSRVPDVQVGASNHLFSNLSSTQQQFAAISQPSIFTTSATPETQVQLFNNQTTHSSQIFTRSLPWVLSGQPSDTEDWAEWSGTVAICGRPVQLSGWEPPENDKYPIANVDLSDWMPWAPILLYNGQELENTSKPAALESKATSNAKARRADASKSWARRLASNRLLPRLKKRRRVDISSPMQTRGTTEEPANPQAEFHLRADIAEDPSGSEDNNTSSADHVQPQELPAPMEVPASKVDVTEPDPKTKIKTEALPHFSMPEYIYPQPAVARAITQRAAEDERSRSIAENVRLQQDFEENDLVDDEETRRLMDEFLLLPDDMREETTGGEVVAPSEVKSNAKKLDLPLLPLPSPVSALSIGVKQGLRPTRSLLDYSTSTRRRALVHFRSEVLRQGAKSLSRKNTEENVTGKRRKKGWWFAFKGWVSFYVDIDLEGLDALPPSKFLLDENGDISLVQRPTMRVRAS